MKYQIYIDDKDVTEFLIQLPIVWRRKSFQNRGLYLDINKFQFDNSSLYFSPDSNNSLFDSTDYNNNVVTLYYGSQKILENIIKTVNISDDGMYADIETMPKLSKYIDIKPEYDTWQKGNSGKVFPAGEYTTINSYPFETPAYAVKHLLEMCNFSDIDADTFARTTAKYVAVSAYIELFTIDGGVTLQAVLNLITEQLLLYIYPNLDGSIGMQHNFDFDNQVELTVENIISMQFLSEIQSYNDYYIEYDLFGWLRDREKDNVGYDYTKAITATANAGGGEVTVTSAAHGRTQGDIVSITGTTDYNGDFEIQSVATNTFNIIAAYTSSQTGNWYYRNIFKVFEVYDNIIKIANSASAEYIGELKINQNKRERKGIKIIIHIDNLQIIDFYTEILMTYFRHNWTQKSFEIFGIGIDIEKSQLNIEAYEIL